MNKQTKHVRKPDWLKIHLGNNEHFSATGQIISSQKLHTICQSGRCPNQGECWNQRSATFMIAGDICTRACKFCNTKSGKPLPLDPDEPRRVASSIRDLDLKHIVLTSVDRDDLPDLGAGHWAQCIQEIKQTIPGITMEVLIPDFQGRTECLDQIISSQPEIVSHNLETVERLTPAVRSVARYHQSLEVLSYLSSAGVSVKSGLMLGLGETEEEVIQSMQDLLNAGCFLLSIGQYLQPSKKNIPVKEYVTPEKFEYYREKAIQLGFKYVESGPLVRSSYNSVKFLRFCYET
ncbi:lipoyl synthase [Bacteroidales bacterium OttesenSCG-928-A17]|nr:lipoyl synthase [Bacteroidales bacterium OttesenSCG-928-A17]